MAAKKKAKKVETEVAETEVAETKAQKFARLGDARVKTALKKISLIGNLSGNGYAYNAKQVDVIKSLLLDEVNSTMKKFDKGAARETVSVSLGEITAEE